MPNANQVALDLAVSDVHVPGGVSAKKPPKKPKVAKPARGSKRVRIRAELGHGGSLHVRHMSNSKFLYGEGVALGAESIVELRASGTETHPRVWNQIACSGHYKGHPAGEFTLDTNVFQQIIANFTATKNRAIPFDFDHASTRPPESGSIPQQGVPAQGWIYELKIVDGNLWGLVEWGSLAREYILSGNYKFLSPVIVFNSKDRVTGKPVGARLASVALTNEPFLDFGKPVAASAKDAGEANAVALSSPGALAHSPSEYMPKVRQALKLNELATAAECSDQLDRVHDHLDSVDGDHTQSPQGVPLSEYCMALRDLVGAAPGDTWDDVFGIVEDLIAAAIGEHEVEDHDAPASESAPAADASLTQAPDAAMSSAPLEIDMTPEEIKALEGKVVTLSSANATLTTDKSEIAVKLSAAENEVNSLKLDAKENQAKLATAETENKRLLSLTESRDKKDSAARVDLAFAQHKVSKGLVDADKESLAIELSASPDRFEARYPKLAPEHVALTQQISGNGGPPVSGAAKGPGLSLRDAAVVLARKQGISIEQAQEIVLRAASH